MLDDEKYVEQLDRSNALAIIAGQADQLKQRYEYQLPDKEGIQNIVVAGMGGSALAAEFVRSWTSDQLSLPITIVRDYSLPAFVSEDSLVIIYSYSGNTEETLSALESARKAKAKLVLVSSGGKLQELAAKNQYCYIQIPEGIQPRLAVLFGVKALIDLLERLDLLNGSVKELEGQADWARQEVSYFTLSIKTAENTAKQIAEKLVGFTPVIYSGPALAMPALKWKIDINENAKNLAFYNQQPEFSHNEFMGWLNPTDKPFRVVQLTSKLDHPQIKKRFEVTARLLSGKMPAPIAVEAQGETKLQQMLWTMLLGDFVSAYLAFLNGVDPTPVDLIEKLKKELP
ncbi:MAG TPA: bifunctional phosphoglucose/phosphomannose isomerase [Candidatus Dormibacteraeota bacterium]|nr:bifunctional phosphoglucose/phosphomannose isomerase [Candidatus Dormibacteraeota bacterium]